MTYYHYTSLDHLREILDEKRIDLTASNLLRPVAPRIVNGTFADPATDNVKPVVWLASNLDFDVAINNGLPYEKTEAVIAIQANRAISIIKWDKWAVANGIEKSWFNALKQTAQNWDNFYISEAPIPITETTGIIFRPDIMKQFNEEMGGARQ